MQSMDTALEKQLFYPSSSNNSHLDIFNSGNSTLLRVGPLDAKLLYHFATSTWKSFPQISYPFL